VNVILNYIKIISIPQQNGIVVIYNCIIKEGMAAKPVGSLPFWGKAPVLSL
jgi:hypothetical protein